MPLPPGQRSIKVGSLDKNGNLTNAKKHAGKRPAASPAKGANVKRSALQVITNKPATNSNPSSTIKKDQSVIQSRSASAQKRRSIRLKEIKAASCVKIATNHVSFKAELKRLKKKDNVSPASSAHSSPLRPLPSFSDAENSSPEKSSSSDNNEAPSPLPTAFHSHSLSPWRTRLNFADLDGENFEKIHESPEYALVIFEYMRYRESLFPIAPKYLSDKQKDLSPEMRAVLVDWMVEVQENFELNHETLYLSVKLVDLLLQQKTIERKNLQLVGATSILIAAKFDERHAPYVDDILYICDDAYSKSDLMEMERNILKSIGYDINIPISYRFLRRFAKCAKTSMETLTLARFILELSLAQYEFVGASDSLMAAAALWLAFKMQSAESQWTDTLIYYSSHKEKDLFDLALQLDAMVKKTKGGKLQTVWQKYSHPIFYEAAKTPSLSKEVIAAEKRRVAMAASTDTSSVMMTPPKQR